MAWRSVVTIRHEDLATAAREERHALGRAMTIAAARTAERLGEAWRANVRAAGLGGRLANAVRYDVWPRPPRFSLRAAARVTTNADEIFEAFETGAVITGKAGNWLAIPTKDTPRSRTTRRGGTRGGRGKASPAEVEEMFNRDLVAVRLRTGTMALIMPNVIRAKNRRGWRRDTQRRLAQGRNPEAVTMFILVPLARMPRLLSLEQIAVSADAWFQGEVNALLAGASRVTILAAGNRWMAG
jgi:hypothetical protein